MQLDELYLNTFWVPQRTSLDDNLSLGYQDALELRMFFFDNLFTNKAMPLSVIKSFDGTHR